MSIEILYEDNHLLAVVKPPDIPVQGDISGALDLLTILKDEIKVRHNKPGNVFLGLVHRLDRPVGGVMVFARTSKAASRLSAQIRDREMDKTYLCIVQGCPGDLKGRLVDSLLKNVQTNTVSVVKPNTPQSKEAILDYEILQQVQGLSLVRIKLLTGRSHQIRVQMSNNGTPLFGDTKYGYKGNKGENIALWSYQIEVEHPTREITLNQEEQQVQDDSNRDVLSDSPDIKLYRTKERMIFTSSPPNIYPWNLFEL